MTTLLDTTTYRRITGDQTSYTGTNLADALADAQKLVEAELRRPVESVVVTERLYASVDPVPVNLPDPILGGRGFVVYPAVTPVTAVPADHILLTSAKVQVPFSYTGYVTYTGGWTLSTAPQPILNALAYTAHKLLVDRLAASPGDLVDPEGNVVPVVPPFGDDSQFDNAWDALKTYIKAAPVGIL